jgi:hypothetical protein
VKGNILFLHLEHSKTKQKFEKQRRFWNRVGVFIAYVNGNVRVQTYNRDTIQAHAGARRVWRIVDIVMPIYFTKKVCARARDVTPLIIESYNLVGNKLRALTPPP